MVTAVGIPQDNRCLRRWALDVDVGIPQDNRCLRRWALPVDVGIADNETNLMSAKLRELMLKHVYYVQRTDGLVRL